MTATVRRALTLVLVASWLAGCGTVAPTPEAQRDQLQQYAAGALRDMTRLDPGLEELVRKGHGHAIFPEVTKGGLVFGGAYGRGAVYERGQHVGYADLTFASFGLQLGGQTYSQLIVFENKETFERFKSGGIDFAADASAIILNTGTATNARFVDGLVIVVRPLAGAMAEAAIGGEQLRYVPK
jgi:lipid-binding SYLF domain-containing protein